MNRTQDLSLGVKRHLLARITAWRRRGLSARASTVLALAGCDTVKQVTALGRGYFEGKPNCAGKTLQELADLAGWSPEHRTPVDAVAASLRLSIPDPAEARNAATDAVIGLRRAGFVIAARRSEPAGRR